MREVKKLYRKDNKQAANYHHNMPPGDFSDERHSKMMKSFEGSFLSMHGKKERGMDYTPLFKFLLSKVGAKWNDVHSEAVSRLDKEEPIFWMVRLQISQDEYPVVRLGENSYYSKLTVDEDGIIIKVDPSFESDKMKLTCDCCTHTFNGEVYGVA